MSESNGEARILALVQACTSFTTANTSRCDWKVLNKGKADHYAILKPGANSGEWITPLVYRWSRTTIIELWQRYTDDISSEPNLETQCLNLETGIMSTLVASDTTGTIDGVNIKGWGDTQEMWKRGGGPAWLRRDLTISWNEEVKVTR